MERVKLTRTCSIWRALEVLGDVPTLMLIGASFMGRRRFEEFEKATLLQKPILSDRLQSLVEAGVFRRQVYSERPLRQEYRLTAAGAALHPVCLAFLGWEAKWDTSADALFNVGLQHVDCGQTMVPVAVRKAGRLPFCVDDFDWEDGSGRGFILAQHRRRRRQADIVSLRQAKTVFPQRINNIIGDRWSALVIRALMRGLSRYDEVLEDTLASSNILSDRLVSLAAKGVLEHRGDGGYELTAAGRDIFPIMVMMMRWGDRWRSAPEGPPIVLRDRSTGEALEPDIACSCCGGSLTLQNLTFREELQASRAA